MDKEMALEKATHLLSMMKTSGWASRVWENLGWHYAFENSQGLIVVHPTCNKSDNGQKYFCMITDERDLPGCGSMMWTDDHNYFDPNDAVSVAVKMARDKVNELNSIVREIEYDLSK